MNKHETIAICSWVVTRYGVKALAPPYLVTTHEHMKHYFVVIHERGRRIFGGFFVKSYGDKKWGCGDFSRRVILRGPIVSSHDEEI